MGRQEKSLDPTHGPVERFAHDLRQLRQQAGTPTYRAMAAKPHCSANSLLAAASGARLPTLTVALAYVRACDGDPQQWQQRWHDTRRQLQQGPAAASLTAAPPPDTVTDTESSGAADSAPDSAGPPVPAGVDTDAPLPAGVDALQHAGPGHTAEVEHKASAEPHEPDTLGPPLPAPAPARETAATVTGGFPDLPPGTAQPAPAEPPTSPPASRSAQRPALPPPVFSPAPPPAGLAPSGQVRLGPPGRKSRRGWWRNRRRLALYLASVVILTAAAVTAAAVLAPGTPEPASSAAHPQGVSLPTQPGTSTPQPPTSSPTPELPTTPTSRSAPRHSSGGDSGNHRKATGVTGTALLGAPDFDGYCTATRQGHVELVRNDAYGWHCTSDNGTGDDAQAVCAWTYGTDQLTNRVADFNNPHSWECWHTRTGRLGSLNFNRYCQITGHHSATYVQGRDAYGWYCTGSNDGVTPKTPASASTTPPRPSAASRTSTTRTPGNAGHDHPPAIAASRPSPRRVRR
ncbi:hypothetical protein GCM10009727_83170 [Actinomadura napierensis]|uniref:Helix-turn-helix domain-containing protein n=2 Tax=Actinomadura napierensis TaxID=267854 RepID=A0ABN3AFK8_9ACTN